MLVCLALLMTIPTCTYAQRSDKELKKDLKSGAVRDNKKTAKELKKEGWTIMPGKLPMERQIQDAQYAELDETAEGEKRFFVGSHTAIGGNYTAAKQMADDRARLELAAAVNAMVAQKIEQQIANKDFGDGDLQVIDEFVSANKSVVAAQLSGITPVLEIYRPLPKGQVEVRTMVKVDAQKALKAAREALRPGLAAKAENLARSLDLILPY